MRKLPNYEHFVLSVQAKRDLRGILRPILAEPRRFDMLYWFDTVRSERRFMDSDEYHRLHPPCGTVACIGGWLVLNKYKRKRINPDLVETEASRILGIEGRAYAHHIKAAIFQSNQWPNRFAYNTHAHTLREIKHNARVAEQYIQYILEHGIPYREPQYPGLESLAEG